MAGFAENQDYGVGFNTWTSGQKARRIAALVSPLFASMFFLCWANIATFSCSRLGRHHSMMNTMRLWKGVIIWGLLGAGAFLLLSAYSWE